MKNLDLERLTLGEVATIESLAKMPLTAIGDDDRPVGNMLAALVMVAKRRNGEPSFTFNQALALPLVDAHEVLGIDDEEEDADGAPTDTEPTGEPTDTPAPKARTKKS